MEKKDQQKNMNSNLKFRETKPDDVGSIIIQGHIKIFDPQTKKELVNKRA